MPDRPSRSLWYAACQPSEGHRGINERFGDLHRLGGGQRGVELIQPIRSLADGVEWNFRSELLQEGQRAEKVCRLTSPAATNLQVLAIDCGVHVDGAVAAIRVVASYDVAASVASQIGTFFERARRAGCFNHHIDAFAVRERSHVFASLLHRSRR